jgi:hypothetical protein
MPVEDHLDAVLDALIHPQNVDIREKCRGERIEWAGGWHEVFGEATSGWDAEDMHTANATLLDSSDVLTQDRAWPGQLAQCRVLARQNHLRIDEPTRRDEERPRGFGGLATRWWCVDGYTSL